ncbi:MAG: hypothetical protein H7263_18420, partial [Candidatus Sericytochromatia bacterium]|nr:hypothetical protein [Candidatus Sericytochromatia bacterium]
LPYMLLKPNEVQFIELEEDLQDNDLLEEDSETGVIAGKPVLIGGNDAPIYLDFDLDFLDTPTFEQEDEEITFANEIIVIGGDYVQKRYYSDDNESESLDQSLDYNSSLDLDEDLYSLDSEFDLDKQDDFYLEPDFADETEIEKEIKIGKTAGNWDKLKHATLMGKVDDQLLSKIKEYRENIHEMSQEKLSTIASGESRDRLLMEASQFADDLEPTKDINQIISKVDSKITDLVKKYSDIQLKSLSKDRNKMLKDVEFEVEGIISQQIDAIKSDAEEHIDETVQYYKKKLEGDNQLLSTANNIIARREQILDEAYEKSLAVVEEAEDKSAAIIEQSAHAHEAAENIIAEFELKGEELKQEAEVESERILADANVESARIIQAAEDQHQDIVDAATQDGFSVGYQEGKEEAIKENSELLREATNALNKLHAAFPIAVKQNEEKLTKIAYQISESVLGEKMDEKLELTQKVLNSSIRQVSNLNNVKIKVNPSDLDAILTKQEYFKSVIPDVQEFIILGDNNIAKGGCIILTKSDEIDISINTQLSILEAVFNDVLAEQNNEYQQDY